MFLNFLQRWLHGKPEIKNPCPKTRAKGIRGTTLFFDPRAKRNQIEISGALTGVPGEAYVQTICCVSASQLMGDFPQGEGEQASSQ